MENANEEVISSVNTLAEERFLLELQENELTRKFKSDEAALNERWPVDTCTIIVKYITLCYNISLSSHDDNSFRVR